jgi:hypothetical protein
MIKEIKMKIQGKKGGKILAVPPSMGTPVAPNDQGDQEANSRESKGEQRGRIERNVTVSKHNKPNTLKPQRKEEEIYHQSRAFRQVRPM